MKNKQFDIKLEKKYKLYSFQLIIGVSFLLIKLQLEIQA